jgi:hypothetical protein
MIIRHFSDEPADAVPVAREGEADGIVDQWSGSAAPELAWGESELTVIR